MKWALFLSQQWLTTLAKKSQLHSHSHSRPLVLALSLSHFDKKHICYGFVLFSVKKKNNITCVCVYVHVCDWLSTRVVALNIFLLPCLFLFYSILLLFSMTTQLTTICCCIFCYYYEYCCCFAQFFSTHTHSKITTIGKIVDKHTDVKKVWGQSACGELGQDLR